MSVGSLFLVIGMLIALSALTSFGGVELDMKTAMMVLGCIDVGVLLSGWTIPNIIARRPPAA